MKKWQKALFWGIFWFLFSLSLAGIFSPSCNGQEPDKHQQVIDFLNQRMVTKIDTGYKVLFAEPIGDTLVEKLMRFREKMFLHPAMFPDSNIPQPATYLLEEAGNWRVDLFEPYGHGYVEISFALDEEAGEKFFIFRFLEDETLYEGNTTTFVNGENMFYEKDNPHDDWDGTCLISEQDLIILNQIFEKVLGK